VVFKHMIVSLMQLFKKLDRIFSLWYSTWTWICINKKIIYWKKIVSNNFFIYFLSLQFSEKMDSMLIRWNSLTILTPINWLRTFCLCNYLKIYSIILFHVDGLKYVSIDR
jgi:hypothetical protein